LQKRTLVENIYELRQILNYYFNELYSTNAGKANVNYGINHTKINLMNGLKINSAPNASYIEGMFNGEKFYITFNANESLEFSVSNAIGLKTKSAEGIKYFYDEKFESERMKNIFKNFVPFLNTVMSGTEPIVSFDETDLKTDESKIVLIWDILTPYKTKNRLTSMFENANARKFPKNKYARYSIKNLQIWQGGVAKLNLPQSDISKIVSKITNMRRNDLQPPQSF
jgi:hypothetical protein